MCWSKKNPADDTTKSETPETRVDICTAYWVDGGESDYSYCLDWAIKDSYGFGRNVYVGKVTKTYIKDDYGWLYQQSVQFSDEKLIPQEVLFPYIKEHFCWIDDQSELSQIEDDEYYAKVFVPKKVAGILKGKYSEAFSLVLAERCQDSRRLVDRALAFYEEGLSPDMRAYLLLMDSENKRTG